MALPGLKNVLSKLQYFASEQSASTDIACPYSFKLLDICLQKMVLPGLNLVIVELKTVSSNQKGGAF